jgi:LL-diaminopimelate aminotransferase
MTSIQPADRIASFKPYFFASLSQKLAALKQKGVDVIRIDMGSPDLPPAEFIVDSLVKSAQRSDTHGYSPNGGTAAYRQAVAEYYGRRFGVELDPQKEVLGLIGSKEGLFNLSQVLVNPGDLVLVPDPGYPVYKASGIIAGAEIYSMPLLQENGFLPDLKQIPESVARRARILWINYPNNPTGAIATDEFYRQVIDFARQYNIVIAHDAPYADVCFDGYKAPSILQYPGAKEIAIEFNSLSKAYNMAGWRVGMAVGNAQVIGYLNTYKSQMDSSHFTPILDAGVTALTSDQSWIEDRNGIYQERRDIVLNALRKVGFEALTPPAAIYIWAKLPKGEMDSMNFCARLLEETGVSTTPGVVYGQYGEGYLRISLGTSTDRMKEAMQRLMEWVK